MAVQVQTGDILLYRKGWLVGRMVQFGEILEDGLQAREYYHVAIAMSPTTKIEADGKQVAFHDINFSPDVEEFDVYRLPIDEKMRDDALKYIGSMIGQKYDWFAIADQGLRDLTGGEIHLPEKFIESKEVHEKICSTLATVYMARADFKPALINKHKFNSPEDVYLLVKDFYAGTNA